MNRVTLIGRITNDLELRATESGKNNCNFFLAVNRTGQEGTDFIKISSWNKQAENLCKYMKKGSQIAVEGQYRVNQYQDKDGNNRYDNYVLASNIEFLSNSKQTANEEVEETGFEDMTKFKPEDIIIESDDLPF